MAYVYIIYIRICLYAIRDNNLYSFILYMHLSCNALNPSKKHSRIPFPGDEVVMCTWCGACHDGWAPWFHRWGTLLKGHSTLTIDADICRNNMLKYLLKIEIYLLHYIDRSWNMSREILIATWNHCHDWQNRHRHHHHHHHNPRVQVTATIFSQKSCPVMACDTQH